VQFRLRLRQRVEFIAENGGGAGVRFEEVLMASISNISA
jgi:hypothetical protein